MKTFLSAETANVFFLIKIKLIVFGFELYTEACSFHVDYSK